MSKVENPKQDWGYYATTPRLVRTGYKNLTPTQKWLYVCLKDLCGDHGMCFRTLRTLSEETDISIAMLSESIPVLHKAGLIHAQKKRRSNNPTGKEVWHITIVDIWGANAKEHPTSKRSQNEQERSPDEQTSENVHYVNENVHSANENRPECSPNEQKCSQNRAQSNNRGSNTTTEGTTREEITSTEGLTGEGVGESESPPQETPPPEKPQSSKSSYAGLRSQWIAAYGQYGDNKWDNDALKWIAEQGGSFDDIKLLYEVVTEKRPEKVKNAWYRLSALKKKKAPPGEGEPLFSPPGYDAADEFGRYYGINEKRETRGVSHAATI